MFLDVFTPDNRPAMLGWETGHYCCTCRNCGKGYTGRKCSYHCSDCAYNYTSELEYEALWRNVGWQYTLGFLAKIMERRKNDFK